VGEGGLAARDGGRPWEGMSLLRTAVAVMLAGLGCWRLGVWEKKP
jgi:hypothetical protein